MSSLKLSLRMNKGPPSLSYHHTCHFFWQVKAAFSLTLFSNVFLLEPESQPSLKGGLTIHLWSSIYVRDELIWL